MEGVVCCVSDLLFCLLWRDCLVLMLEYLDVNLRISNGWGRGGGRTSNSVGKRSHGYRVRMSFRMSCIDRFIALM